MENNETKIRIELGQIIRELLDGASETRAEELDERADMISPDPHWSSHIFYSDEFITNDGTLLLDKLLDKIFSYKPIQL